MYFCEPGDILTLCQSFSVFVNEYDSNITGNKAELEAIPFDTDGNRWKEPKKGEKPTPRAQKRLDEKLFQARSERNQEKDLLKKRSLFENINPVGVSANLPKDLQNKKSPSLKAQENEAKSSGHRQSGNSVNTISVSDNSSSGTPSQRPPAHSFLKPTRTLSKGIPIVLSGNDIILLYFLI